MPRRSTHQPRPSRADTTSDRAAVESLLAMWVPDPRDREFVARCVVDEGPPHHRGASLALLALLQRALATVPAREKGGPPGPAAVVPLRLPPHVRETLAPDEREYPITMPTDALERAFPDPVARSFVIESLTDGPPHHALANVIMVAMLDELLRRLGDAT